MGMPGHQHTSPSPAQQRGMTQRPASPKDQLRARVQQDFAFHKAGEQKGALHDRVRAIHREAAEKIVDLLQVGRELSLSLTALEESMHWANAAVAKNTEAAAEEGLRVEREQG